MSIFIERLKEINNMVRFESKRARFELEKNLAHLQILIKQNHTEVEALQLDTSGDCPCVYIYYSPDKNEASKLFFNFDDDPLNLYRRILDDIIDTAFVSKNKCFANTYPPMTIYQNTDSCYSVK